MSLLGTVWNKALHRFINVYLGSSGLNYVRYVAAIDEAVKAEALERTRVAFEGGKLFKEDDMKAIDRLTITHVPVQRSNEGDSTHLCVSTINHIYIARGCFGVVLNETWKEKFQFIIHSFYCFLTSFTTTSSRCF